MGSDEAVLEAEQGYLGAIMAFPVESTRSADPGLAAMQDGLREDAFAYPRHRTVWRAIQAIGDGGGTPDLATVTAYLKREGALEQAGGAVYLTDLVVGVPHAAWAVVCLPILRRAASVRAIREAAAAVLEHLRGPDAPVEELCALLQKMAASVLEGLPDRALAQKRLWALRHAKRRK